MSEPGAHSVLARLRALDPAGDDAATPASAHDATLQHIFTIPRDQAGDELLPRRRSFPMAAAGVLAVVALAVGVVVWGMGPQQVYATWTPAPEPISQQHRQVVTAACPMVAHEIVGEGEDSQVEQVSLEPVLIDRRGEHSYVIGADDEGRYAECFLTAADGQVRALAATDATESPMQTMAAEEEVTVLHAGTTEWSQDGDEVPGALTSVFGHATSDVSQVVLRTEGGEQVHATVQGGWWAAWAPGDDSFTDQATVILQDGTTTQHQVDPTGS